MKRNQRKQNCALLIFCVLLFATANCQDYLAVEGHWHIPCIAPTPTGLFSDSITKTSAKLHASVPSTGVVGAFFYKGINDTVWIRAIGNPASISHLLPGTTYEYYAVAGCLHPNIYGTSPRRSTSAYFTTLKKLSLKGYFTSLTVYPNPVQGSAIISFVVPHPERVTIAVLNNAGGTIKTLADQQFQAGGHQITLNTNEIKNSMPTGIYFLRIQSGVFLQMQKLIVIK